MKRFAKFLPLLVCAFLLLPVLALSQSASLTILHTNDTHGHLLPFSYPASAPPGSESAGVPVRRNIGGIARRATLVKNLREELGRNGTTVWLIDAGDFSDGTPFSTEYHGEADIAAMNAAKYDFATLGNHEFNNPLSMLKHLLTLFQFPVLCANVFEESTGRLLTQASEIRELPLRTPAHENRELPTLKIGLFGLVTREAADYQAGKEGVTISDEIKAAEEMVRALRQKSDIIIAISHSGEQKDEAIARAVPGIDIIVGGHSHTRLASGDFVWHSDQLKPKSVNGTIIVQDHQWAGELGRLDLLFEMDEQGAWHVDRYRARLIPITPSIPEDAEVAAVVAHYWDPIAKRFGEVIGEAAGDFVARGDDLAPYNLFTDSIRELFKTEIEFENMGGIRADLVAGKITREDLVGMDPFNNTIVTFRMSGRRIKELLLKYQPAVSGLQYRIENGKLVAALFAGRPVQDGRIYSCATNSFFARNVLKGMQVKDTGKQRLDSVITVIRKKGLVKPVYDGRRVIVD